MVSRHQQPYGVPSRKKAVSYTRDVYLIMAAAVLAVVLSIIYADPEDDLTCEDGRHTIIGVVDPTIRCPTP
jgi:hypothetical protein